jgi:hypothetical protein
VRLCEGPRASFDRVFDRVTDRLFADLCARWTSDFGAR